MNYLTFNINTETIYLHKKLEEVKAIEEKGRKFLSDLAQQGLEVIANEPQGGRIPGTILVGSDKKLFFEEILKYAEKEGFKKFISEGHDWFKYSASQRTQVNLVK